MCPIGPVLIAYLASMSDGRRWPRVRHCERLPGRRGGSPRRAACGSESVPASPVAALTYCLRRLRVRAAGGARRPVGTGRSGREGERGRVPKPADSPEWLDIRARRFRPCREQRPARARVPCRRDALRIEGPVRLLPTLLSIASVWLSEFWDHGASAGRRRHHRAPQSALSRLQLITLLATRRRRSAACRPPRFS